MSRILFLGYGRMGKALAASIDADTEVFAFDKRTAVFANQSRVQPVESIDNFKASAEDIVFICVEPSQMDALAKDVAPVIGKSLLVSIMAGPSLSRLESAFGSKRVIRVMPNTPVRVGEGLCFVCRSESVKVEDLNRVVDILEKSSEVFEIEEKFFNLITSLAGSGPALVFQLARSFAQAAVADGMDPKTAEKVSRQVFMGASVLMKSSNEPLESLIDQVVTPGGTTEAALGLLLKPEFQCFVNEAIRAGRVRAEELGQK